MKVKPMSKVSSTEVQSLLDENVSKGSMVCTDEARFYVGIKGCDVHMVNHSVGEFVNEMASTNGIESVWAVLKRGYYGTCHHMSKKRLKRYINEFTFRLNEGNCKVDTLDRMKSLCKARKGKRLRYRDLVK